MPDEADLRIVRWTIEPAPGPGPDGESEPGLLIALENPEGEELGLWLDLTQAEELAKDLDVAVLDAAVAAGAGDRAGELGPN